jgi:predicted Abi (CAAX) family protease
MNESRTVLLNPTQGMSDFQEGPFLGLHLFGGYQGPGGDPARPFNLVGGHFAFASGEIRQGQIEMNYHQVYGQNPDQIVSCTQSQEAYLGSLQRGWQYTRPVVDLLISHSALSRRYEFGGGMSFDFFSTLRQELERVQARYRVGDGDGVAEIQAATNCSQDSASAMYAVASKILELDRSLAVYPQEKQYADFRSLVEIARDLKQLYSPWGRAPRAWDDNFCHKAPPAQIPPTQQTLQALASWKTILPRVHHEAVAEILLRHGAQVLVKTSGPLGSAEVVEPPTAPSRLPIS